MSQEADRLALEAMACEFAAGFNTRDVDRIMRFYADRYVDVNLRHPVQTFAERRAYLQHVIGSGDLQVQVTPDEIWVHGDLALVRGTIRLVRSGAPTELRYLEVAHRSPDGWKAVWGMDGPIQEYQP